MAKLSMDVICGRQALRRDEPWIVPEAFEYLKSIVKPSWNVFEWGSGGSTIWFAKQCETVRSVEYRKKWRNRAEKRLAELSLSNAQIWLLSGDEYVDAIDIHEYKFEFEERQHLPDGIELYRDVKMVGMSELCFDLIFVDGERKHRKRCIEKAMTKLAKGGYIMVDNSNWQALVEPLRDWQSVTFKAEPFMYKGKRHKWWTSFYWRPE